MTSWLDWSNIIIFQLLSFLQKIFSNNCFCSLIRLIFVSKVGIICFPAQILLFKFWYKKVYYNATHVMSLHVGKRKIKEFKYQLIFSLRPFEESIWSASAFPPLVFSPFIDHHIIDIGWICFFLFAWPYFFNRRSIYLWIWQFKQYLLIWVWSCL